MLNDNPAFDAFDVPKVVIEVISHEQQRYPTVGDWYFLDDVLHIRVSNMGNAAYHHLVAIHEYVEALLCQLAGIIETSVTKFDLQFEEWRREGKVGAEDEPGNHPEAPYYEQHQFATKIEKQMARQFGIDWEEYDEAVNEL